MTEQEELETIELEFTEREINEWSGEVRYWTDDARMCREILRLRKRVSELERGSKVHEDTHACLLNQAMDGTCLYCGRKV